MRPKDTNVVWVRGGSHSRGERACRGMEALGYRVHAVDYPLDKGVKAAVEFIAGVGTQLEQLHEGSTSVFVGASSGGALAHAAATIDAKGRGAVLVCPVLRPYSRQWAITKKMAEDQLFFFGSVSNMVLWEDIFTTPPVQGTRRAVAYGTCDKRAPWSMPDGWDDCTTLVGVHAGHELRESIDVSLLDQLIRSTTTVAA